MAKPCCEGADLLGLGLPFRFEAGSLGACPGCLTLCLGADQQARRGLLGILRSGDQLDLLATLGDRHLARGEYALLGGDRQGARRLGRSLRLGLGARLLGDRNGAALLGKPQRGAAIHLKALQLHLAADALLFHGKLLGDARAVDALAERNLGLLGLQLAPGALAGKLGALGRRGDADLALLLQPRILPVPVDIECEALGLQVLAPDGDEGVLLDVVAALLALFDLLGNAVARDQGTLCESVEAQLDAGVAQIGAILRCDCSVAEPLGSVSGQLIGPAGLAGRGQAWRCRRRCPAGGGSATTLPAGGCVVLVLSLSAITPSAYRGWEARSPAARHIPRRAARCAASPGRPRVRSSA